MRDQETGRDSHRESVRRERVLEKERMHGREKQRGGGGSAIKRDFRN